MKFDRPDFSTISDIDWARMAAYVDGEGHIVINMYSGKDAERRFAKHYLVVGVTNTDPRLPLWCAETFGGHVITDKHNHRRKSVNRPIYKWMASCRVAFEVVSGCLPYMIIKKEQAEIAIAFQKSMRQIGGHRTKKLSVGEVAFRESCRKDLHDAKWERREVPEFQDPASLETVN